MKRFKHHLVVAGILGIGALSAMIMNAGQGVSQNPNAGPDVHIVSPLPLPVTITGTTTVAGTLSVRDVDNSARHAFQKSSNLLMSGTGGQGAVFTAPSDKAVVITHITGDCIVASGKVCAVGVEVNQPAALAPFYLQMSQNFVGPAVTVSGLNNFIANQPVHLVITPGNRLDFFASRNTTSPAGTFVTDTRVNVFGYYVECTATAPCEHLFN